MTKNNSIVDALNILMKHELTAIDIYFSHSRIFKNLGINKVFEKLDGERLDEIEHVKLIVDRILYLNGEPDFSQRIPFKGERSIKEMFEEELAFEYAVGSDLKKTVGLCESEQDYGTREMLMILLSDSEKDHIYWLERQIQLIDKVGEQNYIQAMMGESREN